MNCPFCGANYSDLGLDAGRCRSCGGVVVWEDDDPDSLAIQRTIVEIPGTPGRGKRKAARDTDRGRDTDNSVERLRTIWGDTCSSAESPMMTLSSQAPAGGADAGLVIQRRVVQQPDAPQAAAADYELTNVIGEGAAGLVYSARQASVDREVAIKMLKGESDDENQREKFLFEAVVTADLDHPNIVAIHDLGRDRSGDLFYSMKRVQGTPWSDVLPKNSTAENIETLMKVADAVAYAHSRGVTHRDLKPENVMLGAFGEVQVMDWGIALPSPEFAKSRFAENHGMGGTPAYMAPEMATGPIERIGPRSDVYLLGAILFEMVTGFPPHTGRTVMDCVYSAARNEIRETRKSGELLDVAMKAMAMEPADRYPSVLEFQAAIRVWQSHSESIELATRAEAELARAEETLSYDHFSNSVFGFQEALTLWSENKPAREQLAVAHLKYAECALNKDDFDLGLSQLDASNPAHDELRAKLLAAQAENRARLSRLRNIRRLVALLVVAIIGGGTFALVTINKARLSADAARQAAVVDRNKAVAAQNTAEEQRRRADQHSREAERQRAEALRQKDESLRQRIEAETQKERAEDEKDRAEIATLMADRLRARAEEEAYFAEIGLAGEKIATNAFGHALQTLTDQRTSLKSKMRHWEWGRFFYLCNGGLSDVEPDQRAVTTLDNGALIVALAADMDAARTVVGSSTGEAVVWDVSTGQRLVELKHDAPICAVAMTADGTTIATAGGGWIRAWDLSSPDKPAWSIATQDKVLCVGFSPDGQRIAVGSADHKIAIWEWPADEPSMKLLGHLDDVRSVGYSAAGDRIVSASEDGTVRIWNVETGNEVQRFGGHAGAVFSAVFSPDGKRVASGGYDRRLLVWDVADESETKRVEEIRRRVRGEEVESQKFDIFEGHEASIQCVRFSGGGEIVVTSSRDHLVNVWDVDPDSNSVMVGQLRAELPEGADTRLLKSLRGHGGWVLGCAVSRDGRRIVSGGYDRQLKTWDPVSYEEKRVFRADRPVLAADVSPDARQIAAAMDDGTVKLWDAETKKGIGVLDEGHAFLATDAAFFPDGKRILTTGGDDTIRVWDIATGTQRFVIGNTGRRGIADLSFDGSRIVTGGNDKTARVWDAASGRALLTLKPHQDVLDDFRSRNNGLPLTSVENLLPDVTAVAFSPDGNQVFTGDANGKCLLWNAETGERVLELGGHGQTVTAARFLPNGSAVVTASLDNTVAVWNVSSGEELNERLKHPHGVNRMVLSSDGRRVLTAGPLRLSTGDHGNPEFAVWLWNLENGDEIANRNLQNRTVHSVRFMADGKSAVISTTDKESSRHAIWQWNCEQDTLTEYGPRDWARQAAWSIRHSADGKQFLTVGGKGAQLWNIQTGDETTDFRPHGRIQSVAWSLDGKWIVTASSDQTAKIWDAETRQAVTKLGGGHSATVTRAVFSPSGEQVLTAGSDGRAVLWDRVTGNQIDDGPLCELNERIHWAEFFPDGKRICLALDNGKAEVRQTNGNLMRSLDGHAAAVMHVAVSQNGEWVATAGADMRAIVWSVETGKQLGYLDAHSAPLNAVAFSPDRLRLLTAAQDNTAKLWDTSEIALGARAADGPIELKEILSLMDHNRDVTRALFTPDGRHVLTTSRDGTAILWPGDRIDPALRLSEGVTDCRPLSDAQAIDPRAILNSPTHQDLNGWVMTVSIQPEAKAGDVLTPGSSSNDIEIGEVDVFHRAGGDKQLIGTWSGGRDGLPLAIKFNNAASGFGVESVARNVAFAFQRTSSSESHRQIRFTLNRDGSRVTEAVAAEKTVRILGGIVDHEETSHAD